MKADADICGVSMRKIIWSAVRYANRARPRRTPAWAQVASVCGVGSTTAHALCREMGLDPETGEELAATEARA